MFKNCSRLQQKFTGKRHGLAVRVNSGLNSRIVNNPITLNNTNYKGEKGEIDLEGGYCTQGHSRTCLDVSDDKIDLNLWLMSGLLGPRLEAVGTFTQAVPVPEQHVRSKIEMARRETGTFPWWQPLGRARGSARRVMDGNSHVHLGKPALLQLITRLRSGRVQSYFPSLQVNKAFKSAETQPALPSSRPRAFFNKSHTGEVESSAVFCFRSVSAAPFALFFPKDYEGQKPGLLLLLPQRGRDPSWEGC